VLLVGLLLAAGLYAARMYNGLLFHSLTEVFGIAVAVAMFMVFWNTRRLAGNGYFLFVSIAYLFVALIDLVHMLAYPGMGIFPGDNTNRSLQLWVAARALQALSLLLAPLCVGRRIKSGWVILGYILAVMLLFASIATGLFPTCYQQGVGPTTFKVVSEYVICLVLLAAGVLLLRQRSAFEPRSFRLLIGSFAATIVSELALSLSRSDYDLANAGGHLVQVVAFYLLYEALIEIGLRWPYQSLFRDLKHSESLLLERGVELRERIKELDCLYGIAALVEKPGASLDEVLQGTTELLAAAQQFPVAAAARVVLYGREYRTANFRESPWRMGASMIVHDERCGLVEVAYVEPKPEADEGPFLKEERLLLDAVAGRLGKIVERIRAEELLRIKDAAMAEAFDGIAIGDLEGTWTYVNRTFLDMWGYGAEEEVLGRPAGTFWREPDRVAEVIATLFVEGQWVGELVARRRDGSCFDAQLSATTVRDAAGQLVGLIAIFRDVSTSKQIEHALQTSETRYRRLFEAAQDGILILDADTGQIVAVNPFLTEMLGYSREEMLGRKLWEIGPFRDLAAARLAFAELQESGYIRYEDLPLQTSKGRRMDVEFISNVYAVDGKKVIQCNIRDITARKQIERQLRQAKEEWEKTFDAVPDLIAIMDPHHRIVRVNRAMAERLGCQPDACLSQPCYVQVHGTSEPPASCPHSLLLQDHQAHTAEVHEERLGGDFNITVSPLWGINGELLGSVHVARDVTASKRAGDERRLNEMRLNSLLELSLTAGDLSEQEIVQVAIEEAARLTGSDIGYLHFVNPDERTIQLVTWTEATKRQCSAAYDNHYPLDQAGVWADCVRVRKPVVHNDYQNFPDRKGYPEGHTHLVRDASVPVFDADRIALILGVGNKATDYDDTDVRQMLLIGNEVMRILRRKRAEEQLQASLHEKVILLQEVHHRVKNNLQVISSLLDMQAMAIQDPQTLQALQDSRNRVRAMALVHDRLYQSSDLARINGREYLEGVAGYLVGVYAGQAGTVDLHLEVQDILLDLDTAIPCGLIVNELVSNAWKYAFPAGRASSGEIQVRLARQDGNLVLQVRDNGVGLPPDLDIETAPSLGLRLVSMLAKQLQGTLEVERGAGTTFRIVFPAADSAKEVAT
jgi:PAS domain S-box-containing protein